MLKTQAVICNANAQLIVISARYIIRVMHQVEHGHKTFSVSDNPSGIRLNVPV